MPQDPATDSSDRFSTDTLLPQVYDELRRLAAHKMRQESPGQTISGTALLHEAYLRLSKESDGPRWANRNQFFSAAAEAMRRILIERVRAKRRIKRGGEFERADFEEGEIATPHDDDKLLQIDEALYAFDKVDPNGADLVKLRFFAGLTLEEIAEASGVTVRTISRRWAYARAWLAEYISKS